MRRSKHRHKDKDGEGKVIERAPIHYDFYVVVQVLCLLEFVQCMFTKRDARLVLLSIGLIDGLQLMYMCL